MSRGHISKTANLMNCELFPQPAFILHSLEINKINKEVPKNKFESNSSNFFMVFSKACPGDKCEK